MEIYFFDNKIELGMPHSKKISNRLFELRIRGEQEVRIFYTFHSDGAVILHAFVKKQSRIPPRELATAQYKLLFLDKR